MTFNTLTKKEAEDLLRNIDVVKAWASGRQIQFKHEKGDWRDAGDIAPLGFINNKERYRVKPREAVAVYKSDKVGPVALFSNRSDADAFILSKKTFFPTTNEPTYEIVKMVEEI